MRSWARQFACSSFVADASHFRTAVLDCTGPTLVIIFNQGDQASYDVREEYRLGQVVADQAYGRHRFNGTSMLPEQKAAGCRKI